MVVELESGGVREKVTRRSRSSGESAREQEGRLALSTPSSAIKLTAYSPWNIADLQQRRLPLGEDETIEVDHVVQDGLGSVDDHVLVQWESGEKRL